ncbi:hypothetical protein AVEN_202884-1 [Araneus ventricosus]|uniref:Uncharacterized protein n=1 Tax=Araneus ventricosus TaxID=182803 RepID=A0A4Y2FIH4_ARAVE|nr:hypothetical protein AVEN_202884-1 [Araneus ventricosus]
MYRSRTKQILFQNYVSRISDSESESIIPNPRNQSESNSDSRIRFRGFITNPIPRYRRIRSFWSKSDPVVPFEEPDPRNRSGVNDSSLLYSHLEKNRRQKLKLDLLIEKFLACCQRLLLSLWTKKALKHLRNLYNPQCWMNGSYKKIII